MTFKLYCISNQDDCVVWVYVCFRTLDILVNVNGRGTPKTHSMDVLRNIRYDTMFTLAGKLTRHTLKAADFDETKVCNMNIVFGES